MYYTVPVYPSNVQELQYQIFIIRNTFQNVFMSQYKSVSTETQFQFTYITKLNLKKEKYLVALLKQGRFTDELCNLFWHLMSVKNDRS